MGLDEGSSTQLSSATEQQFRVGSGLLAQAAEPGAFPKGVALIESASSAGHAGAITQLATLEAMGAGRPQNWERAFDLLLTGAEAGSAHAQAQLELLAGESPTNDWKGLRAVIKLDRLLDLPPRSILSEEPRIRSMEGFASLAECAWVIDRVRGSLGPATVWDLETGAGVSDPNRTNSALSLRLTDMDVVIEVLRARISAATRLPEPIFETPQVMHYTIGQEFKRHYDFLDPNQRGPALDIVRRGQRIATFLIYLNDDFEGGETIFPDVNISFRGRTGDALFWGNVDSSGQPDRLTSHTGVPPTSGEKWIFSQWIRDRSPALPT